MPDHFRLNESENYAKGSCSTASVDRERLQMLTRQVLNCPVCGGQQRSLKYDSLVDLSHGIAEGSWTFYICQDCRSGWLDPRPADSELSSIYSGYYTQQESSSPHIVRRLGRIRTILHDSINAYAKKEYGVELGPCRLGWLIRVVPFLRSAVDAHFRHLSRPIKGRDRLLDVGCGSGNFLRLASSMGWKAEGVDFDPVATAIARRNGLVVHLGGLEGMSEYSEQFDVITLSHVIEHLAYPREAIEQVSRLLKPGGTVWVQTPNLRSFGAMIFGRNWRGLEPPRHFVVFNQLSLTGLLQSAGFKSIRSKRDGLNVFPVFSASMKIKSGGGCRSPIGVALDFCTQAAFELIESVVPTYREYSTLTATKPQEQASVSERMVPRRA